MDIKSILTGHSSKESDVYANYDVAQNVISAFQSIRSNELQTAQEAILQSINELNSVNGFAEYVGTVNVSEYTSVFEYIDQKIDELETSMTDKVDRIKAYEQSPLGTKLLSTGGMLLSKVGEGFLSVFEGIGDGVVSIVGWGAGILGAKGFSEDCANFVKKNLSHDAFNFYYNSEFAKASMITEDSGIAKVAKFGGQMVGFMALGAGVTSMSKAFSASNISGLQSIGAFASSAKNVSTVEAALMGMGSGTEAGLKAGKTLNQAALGGFASAALAGGLAYGLGTLAEKWAAKKAASNVKTETPKSGFQTQEGTKSFRGTSIREGSVYTTESGNSYNLSGGLTDDAGTGALKHMAEEVEKTTTRSFNLEESANVLKEASEITGDQSYARAAERILSQGQEVGLKSKTGKTIRNALDILRDAHTPEEFQAIVEGTYSKSINASQISRLASQSGLEFPAPELLSKTSQLTQEEIRVVEEYAAQASQKIYGTAIENFDRGLFVQAGNQTQAAQDLMGVPVRVNGAVDGADPYIIEVLTRPSHGSETADITIKHLLHTTGEDFASGISIGQAVQNQADRAIQISTNSSRYDIIDSVISDISGQTLTQDQILDRVANGMIDHIVNPAGELYIAEQGSQQAAADYIRSKLIGSTADQSLVSQIISRILGN